jgi:hypothetical protein
MHDLCLRSDPIDYRDSRPIVGITHSATSLSLIQVYVEEKRVVVRDQLTDTAVRVILESDGCTEPLYITKDAWKALRDAVLSVSVHVVESDASVASFQREVLRQVGRSLAISIDEFRIVGGADSSPHMTGDASQQSGRTLNNRPLPIYVSTATQIGLLPNPNIPPLVPYLLPPVHANTSATYWKNILLNPPPSKLVVHLQSIFKILSCVPPHSNRPYPIDIPPEQGGEQGGADWSLHSFPHMHTVSLGKMVTLLSTEQCNTATFREIHSCLSSVLELIDGTNLVPAGDPTRNSLADHLLALASHESGITIDLKTFHERVAHVASVLQQTLASSSSTSSSSVPPSFHHQLGHLQSADHKYNRVPVDFFARNEGLFVNTLAIGTGSQFYPCFYHSFIISIWSCVFISLSLSVSLSLT